MARAENALVCGLKVSVGCQDRLCVNSDTDKSLAESESRQVSEVLPNSSKKSDMLRKEIKSENETQSDNIIYPGLTLQQHHTHRIFGVAQAFINQKLHRYQAICEVTTLPKLSKSYAVGWTWSEVDNNTKWTNCWLKKADWWSTVYYCGKKKQWIEKQYYVARKNAHASQ